MDWTLNKVECLLSCLEQLIPTNCTWALGKCLAQQHLPPACDLCPHLSALISKDTAVSFSLPLGPGEGEQPGRPWQAWSTSTRPRIPRHSEVTGFFPVTHLSFPGHTSRETKKGPVRCQVKACSLPERTFFSNNYCIIISLQERHDVKSKLLKTFLD